MIEQFARHLVVERACARAHASADQGPHRVADWLSDDLLVINEVPFGAASAASPLAFSIVNRPRDAETSDALLCSLRGAADQDVLVADLSFCTAHPDLTVSRPHRLAAPLQRPPSPLAVTDQRTLRAMDEADSGVVLAQVVGTRLLMDSVAEQYHVKAICLPAQMALVDRISPERRNA